MKLILVRHAAYGGSGQNPGLSDEGKMQAAQLARLIEADVEGDIVIWSSTAKRASETAEIILNNFSKGAGILSHFEKLWSDNWHEYDFDWLKRQLNEFQGETLVLVSHLEYVQWFPAQIGFKTNDAGYAEGVKIHDGECVYFG